MTKTITEKTEFGMNCLYAFFRKNDGKSTVNHMLKPLLKEGRDLGHEWIITTKEKQQVREDFKPAVVFFREKGEKWFGSHNYEQEGTQQNKMCGRKKTAAT